MLSSMAYRRSSVLPCQYCRSMFSTVPHGNEMPVSASKRPMPQAPSSGNIAVKSAEAILQSSAQSNGRARAADCNFYQQQKVAQMAEKKSTRLTPRQLMYATKPCELKYLLRSAAYLHNELPVRVSHMVRRFQRLPYLVGQNPHIASVHQLYILAFKVLTAVKPIKTTEDESQYSELLTKLLQNHEDVVTMLARGFRECRSIMPIGDVQGFLDSFVTSRLGIRLLTEHHIAMHQDAPGHIGLVKTKLSPADTIEVCARFAQSQCEQRFFRFPKVDIVGDTAVTFPYFAMPLKYILEEVLKNAIRATVERHPNTKDLPPVTVTICNNDSDFTIRISDLGGGIPAESVQRIQEYMFTTSGEVSVASKSTLETCGDRPADDGDGMDGLGVFIETTQQTSAGPMSGFGFGLPTSCAFAKFLGGSVSLQSMFGRGTDVYIHLKHFNSPHHTIYF